MSITRTQTEPLNYIHPLAPKVVNFGVDTFLVNVNMANEEGVTNGDDLPDPVIEKLEVWQAEARKEHKPAPTPLDDLGETLFIHPYSSSVFLRKTTKLNVISTQRDKGPIARKERNTHEHSIPYSSPPNAGVSLRLQP
jgi:hypothetical protein